MTLEELEKKIKKEFKDAEKGIIAKANEYFENFEFQDKQMRKKMKSKKITKKAYINWRKEQMLVGAEYRKMEIAISEMYKNSFEIANQLINDTTPFAFAESLNYATYEIEKDASINTSFTLVDEGTVTSLIRDNPNLIPQAAIKNGFDVWQVGKINSALLQGVLLGDSIDTIAKRLKNVTNQDINSSIRTARTLTTACENLGRMRSYERAIGLGIKLKKIWIATNDNRTRHSHALLDEEMVEVEEEFSNGCKFPGDPDGKPSEIYNCRCSMRTKVEGFDYSDQVYKDMKVASMGFDRWKRSRR